MNRKLFVRVYYVMTSHYGTGVAKVSTDPSLNPLRCPKCNAPVSPQDKFCENCSAKLEPPRTCGNCGAPVVEGMKFCENCGAPVATQAPQETQPEAAAPTQSPAPATPPAEPATPARSSPAAPAPAAAPTQAGGTSGPDRKILIAGIVGAVVVIIVVLLFVLPMFSGAGSGSSSASGTSAATMAATSAKTTGSFTPGPTQTIPAKYTVLLEVDKNKITGDTTVRAVGSDLGVVKYVQVTLYEQDGQTVSDKLIPNKKDNTVTLEGSTRPERVQVTVVFYSGEQYTPIDKIY